MNYKPSHALPQQKSIRTDLHLFLGCIVLLLIIGSVCIYSSSSVFALEQHGSAHYFLKKQLMGIIIGFTGLIIISLIPLSGIKRLTPPFFIATMGLTALSLIPYFTSRIHGSNRWVKLASFSFQPSELLKVGLLLYIAYFLDKKIHTQKNTLHPFISLCIIIAVPTLILLKQPDFGCTATLVSTVLMVCFIAEFQIKRIFLSMIGLIPLTVALIIKYPYRMKRITTFLNPWHDPQGSGFQIIQSLIAIGSGGVAGIGIGQSRQKFFYLPMQHTDFIFSIIAEETGCIGILFLIGIYISLLYLGIRIACAMHNPFSRFFILGATILITIQTIINMAVATGIAPTKGIGLPFISYGNTSLVTSLAMVGIIVAMVKEHLKTKHYY